MPNFPQGLLAQYRIWLVTLLALSLRSFAESVNARIRSLETRCRKSVPHWVCITATSVQLPTCANSAEQGAAPNKATFKTKSQVSEVLGRIQAGALPHLSVDRAHNWLKEIGWHDAAEATPSEAATQIW